MSELIISIEVATYEAQILEGNNSRVVMIPFSAEAKGGYFTGKTIANGVETQITTQNGFSVSARYMLEGTDRSGKRCRLFIENTRHISGQLQAENLYRQRGACFSHQSGAFRKG